MIVSEIELNYRAAEAELLPRLRGRVFHVTCSAYLPAIFSDRSIKANLSSDLPTAFGGSKNSFFRLRGCVSVFDYRDVTQEQLEVSLRKCSPYQAGHRCNFELAIFFLSPSTYGQLVPWTKWKETESYGEMVVPHVEAGHSGDITLDSIDELLKVRMLYEPSAFELAVREARKKRDD